MSQTAAQKKAAEKRAAAKEAKKDHRLVKYMGTSHVRVIPEGDQIGGELVDGVESTVEWDIDNHHIADLTEAGWSVDSIDALLDYGTVNPETEEVDYEFVEVTGQKRVAPSLGQILWRGARPHVDLDPAKALPKPDTDADDARAKQSGAKISLGNGDGAAGEPGTEDPALGASD